LIASAGTARYNNGTDLLRPRAENGQPHIFGRWRIKQLNKGVRTMPDHAPRCPFCANVLKLQPTFWERIGLKTNRTNCPTCQRPCNRQDARMMGSAYGHWAESFRQDLIDALAELPVLAEATMHRALGCPHRDDTHLMPSVDELVRICMRHQRSVLIEMARGREATLEVAPLRNDTSRAVEVLAVLGTTSTESGAKEFQQLIARHSHANFVVYTHPGKDGAEPRLKQAIHENVHRTRALTDAHVDTIRKGQEDLRHAHHG
jgi:hypothetical protein